VVAGVTAGVVAPLGIGIALLAANGHLTTATTSAPASPGPTTRPVALSTQLPATRAAILTIDQIISGVRAAETSFHNLYIKDFRTTVDIMPAGQNQWKPSPIVYAGSAWYDADPRGKTRVYYATYVMPWEPLAGQRPMPGQVPWVAQEVDESWDGKQGREVRVTSGFPGKARRDDSAIITPDRPMLLNGYSRYDTGAGFTWQYRVSSEELSTPPGAPLPFSDFISRSVKAGEPPEISRQTVNGFDTVRLRWVGFRHQVLETYWVAPECGFALVKQERIMNMPKLASTEGLEVKELKEIAKGIWFPMRASMVMRYGGRPDEYWRFNYSAAAAVANDPKFDPSIFTATIPAGYVVGDQRENRRDYLIMPNGTEDDLHRGDVLPNVKPGRPQRPDAPK
jgi:hypothetical protein